MALGLGLIGSIPVALSQCVSPSTESGVAATTVYRCPDKQDAAAPKQPLIASPEKTTVVERGPAQIPWFEPKRLERLVEAMAAVVPAPPLNPQTGETRRVEASREAEEGQQSDERQLTDEKKIETKPVLKAKGKATAKAKTKTTAKPVRKKLAQPTSPKTKTAKATPAKAGPDTKTPDGKNKTGNTDDNTVVWTREDMPLGSRIVNWLGL